MEAQHQMLRIEADKIEWKRDVQQTKHRVQLNQGAAAAAAAAAASPPPSASLYLSHEFSFTISFHPPTVKTHDNKIKSSPPSFAAAIDLSPADEIFFHDHLLPLHLLFHLPVLPRPSTNSLDSFTLPIKELLHDDNNNNNDNIINDGDGDHEHHHLRCRHDDHESRYVLKGKGRGKSKSFSLFAMPKWRKCGCPDLQEREDDDQQVHKQKLKFELLKRYVRFVKPFLLLRNRRQRRSDEFLLQQPYSYSGNLRVRKKNLMRGLHADDDDCKLSGWGRRKADGGEGEADVCLPFF